MSSSYIPGNKTNVVPVKIKQDKKPIPHPISRNKNNNKIKETIINIGRFYMMNYYGDYGEDDMINWFPDPSKNDLGPDFSSASFNFGDKLTAYCQYHKEHFNDELNEKLERAYVESIMTHVR